MTTAAEKKKERALTWFSAAVGLVSVVLAVILSPLIVVFSLIETYREIRR